MIKALLNKRLLLLLIVIIILSLIAVIAIFYYQYKSGDTVYMDQLAQDNNYHYQNIDLAFALVLPPEFKYYQTQRKEADGKIDIEFFVPTSDTSFHKEVPGYGKPIVIRVLDKNTWQAMPQASEEKQDFVKIGEKGERVYLIKFWANPPSDWPGQWSEAAKNKIIAGFKLK